MIFSEFARSKLSMEMSMETIMIFEQGGGSN